MNKRINILIVAFVVLLSGCKKDWEDHYNSPTPSSNENVWDAIQKDADLSEFVSYMKQYQYDTLFLGNNTYTIFAPTNAAITQIINGGDSITSGVLAYHLSKYLVQTASISGTRKIQTFDEKFALFNNNTEGIFLDDIEITAESPLYRNGKFFKIGQVASPKPNLYEYIALTNPVLKAYIDSEDSVILNKDESIPIGFDSAGNTIYDSVVDIINMFEWEFFPISEEFRNQTATLVFPKEEDYNAALTEMAIKLNAGYSSYEDIPIEWQNEILIPYLLEHGVFENMLEREEFLRKTIRDTVKLKNILGDSVVIDYEPGEKTICSNGYAYNYFDFEVPDTLYNAPTRFEAEWLLETQGAKFIWYPWVTYASGKNWVPSKIRYGGASNDSIMTVSFDKGYTGTFKLKFNIDNLFPRKYLAIFRINPTKGGIYNIYMNNVLVRTFDYGLEISDYYVVNSVIPGVRYYPKNGYTRFDFWVENLETYGQAVMRIEYVGPGTALTNGLAVDYIDFKPY